MRVIRDCGGLLFGNLWPILSLSLLNSAARFALCWGLYKTVAAGMVNSAQRILHMFSCWHQPQVHSPCRFVKDNVHGEEAAQSKFCAVHAVAVGFFDIPAASIPQEMLPPVGEEGDPAGKFERRLS